MNVYILNNKYKKMGFESSLNWRSSSWSYPSSLHSSSITSNRNWINGSMIRKSRKENQKGKCFLALLLITEVWDITSGSRTENNTLTQQEEMEELWESIERSKLDWHFSQSAQTLHSLLGMLFPYFNLILN